MKPIGELLADIHCRNQGFTEGSPEYEETFKKEVYRFNDEAWGLSMTPSGLIKENPLKSNPLSIEPNPATPKVQAHYFDIMEDIFGKRGFIAENITGEERQLHYKRQFRGVIASMAHLLLKAKYKVQIKGNNASESDFEFKKDGGKSNDETVLHQYQRLYYSVLITKAIEKVFNSKKVKIEDVINDVFEGKLERLDYASLNPKDMREYFVSALYNGKQSPAESRLQIEQNPSKKSKACDIDESVYFSHDSGLYFDKRLIDKYLKENANDCVQIRAKAEYVLVPVATDLEIKNADMRQPILFGSEIKNGKNSNFLILGEAQIMKAVEKGFPLIDGLILDHKKTIEFLRPTKKTMAKITKMKTDLKSLK